MSQNKTHFDKKYCNIARIYQNYCSKSGWLLVTLFLRQSPKPEFTTETLGALATKPSWHSIP
jgi:hypothetical protein